MFSMSDQESHVADQESYVPHWGSASFFPRKIVVSSVLISVLMVTGLLCGGFHPAWQRPVPSYNAESAMKTESIKSIIIADEGCSDCASAAAEVLMAGHKAGKAYICNPKGGTTLRIKTYNRRDTWQVIPYMTKDLRAGQCGAVTAQDTITGLTPPSTFRVHVYCWEKGRVTQTWYGESTNVGTCYRWNNHAHHYENGCAGFERQIINLGKR